MAVAKEEILEAIAKLTLVEVVELIADMEKKFGVTAARGDLLIFRDYLSGLLDYTQKKITAGEPKEKIVALDNLPGFPDFHQPVGPGNRLPANLGVAFDELTDKKA